MESILPIRFQYVLHMVGCLFILFQFLHIGLKPRYIQKTIYGMYWWIVSYLGLYSGYMFVTYYSGNAQIAKFGYYYLVFLSGLSISLSIFTVGKIVKQKIYKLVLLDFWILIILLTGLSLIQLDQSIGLLGKSYNPLTWWIPMFCKHTSLILYLTIWWFINWELDNGYICCNVKKSTSAPIVVVWMYMLCLIIPIFQVPLSIFRLGLTTIDNYSAPTTITPILNFLWSPMFSVLLIWVILRFFMKYNNYVIMNRNRFRYTTDINLYWIFIFYFIGAISTILINYVGSSIGWNSQFCMIVCIIVFTITHMLERTIGASNSKHIRSTSYGWILGCGIFTTYTILAHLV